MSIWDKIFGRKPRMPYYDWVAQQEKNHNRIKQEYEDKRFQRDARATAMDKWLQWTSNPHGLPVVRPRRFTYTIYNEDSARFLKTKFSDLVDQEFKKILCAK